MIPILLKILQFALTFVTLLALTATIKSRPEIAGDRNIVAYGRPYKALFVFGLLILALMIRDVAKGLPATVTDWRVPTLFGTILIAGLSEVFLRRLEYTESAISLRFPWHGHQTFAWTDISNVKRIEWLQSDLIRFTSGKTFLLPDSMNGKNAFIQRISTFSDPSSRLLE